MGSSGARECKRMRHQVQMAAIEEELGDDVATRGMEGIVCKRRKLPADLSALPASHHSAASFRISPPAFQLCLASDATHSDPEATGFPTAERWIVNGEEFRGEKTALSDDCGDYSDSMPMESSNSTTTSSSAVRPSSGYRRRSAVVVPSPGKMPSAAEIDEFFSAAEKYDQKRFAEKYNYDVVRDVPLEGRYEWVRLNP